MPKKDLKFKLQSRMESKDYRDKTLQIGPSTLEVIEYWLNKYDKPQQGYKMCFSIINLIERHNVDIVEAACKRAIVTNTLLAKEISNIIKTKCYLIPKDNILVINNEPIIHENLRGEYK